MHAIDRGNPRGCAAVLRPSVPPSAVPNPSTSVLRSRDGAPIRDPDTHDPRNLRTQLTIQAPVQLNSLTGTYATSAYLAALRKGPKELDALAKDVEIFDKKIKEDKKVQALIGGCSGGARVCAAAGWMQELTACPLD